MRVYSYNLSDIKPGDPISTVDYELIQQGFSRTATFPGGGRDIKAGTTSIIYGHQDGRRARIELDRGGVKSVEQFKMRPVLFIRPMVASRGVLE